jgi:response regulator RpfG family c-di-GMP phosphodiesterase
MQSEPINILLVDDHPANLLALEAIFSGQGYNLVKANSGNTALECLLKEDFAVVLLDVQMPGLDGFETAALIREREHSRHTPIIFLTAINTSDAHVTKGYSLGAIDYLFKPIVPEILKAKVAVFVDLVKKTRELELTRQREHQDREIRAFEQLSESVPIPVSSQAFGLTSLNKSVPQLFDEFVQRYSDLLDRALEQRAYKVEYNISESLRSIADKLGFLRASPRDVAELHTSAIKKKLKVANVQAAKAYIEEGHLMAFELMGYLVSYYRSFYLSSNRNRADALNNNLPTNSGNSTNE